MPSYLATIILKHLHYGWSQNLVWSVLCKKILFCHLIAVWQKKSYEIMNCSADTTLGLFHWNKYITFSVRQTFSPWRIFLVNFLPPLWPRTNCWCFSCAINMNFSCKNKYQEMESPNWSSNLGSNQCFGFHTPILADVAKPAGKFNTPAHVIADM